MSRMRNHLMEGRSIRPWANRRDTHKLKWLRELSRLGLVPTIKIIEECSGTGSDEECFHIALAKADGLRLTNSTTGGENCNYTPDIGRKISRKLRRFHKLHPEVAASLRGIPRPAEVRAKISASLVGQRRAVESVARQKEFWSSPSHRLAASKQQRRLTDQQVQYLVDAYNEGENVWAIMEAVNCTPSTFYNQLRLHSVPKRTTIAKVRSGLQ